jgi:hypothetical protein
MFTKRKVSNTYLISGDSQVALEQILESIKLDPSRPWTETLVLSYPHTIDVDVDDDLNREVALYAGSWSSSLNLVLTIFYYFSQLQASSSQCTRGASSCLKAQPTLHQTRRLFRRNGKK